MQRLRSLIRAIGRAPTRAYAAVPVQRPFCASLRLLEALVSFVPFLASWLLCAVYRSVLLGWTVSGMDAHDKRKALNDLTGRHENAS